MTDDEPARALAESVVDALREYDGACIQINFAPIGYPYIRYVEGEWRRVERRRFDRVEGRVIDEEDVVDLAAEHSVTFYAAEYTTGLTDAGPSVWELADEQDVFTDRDRCCWCGASDRTASIEAYETTEDGTCLLCEDCHESWEKSGEIVAPATETPS